MGRLKIVFSILLLVVGAVPEAYPQQPDDQKYFLGSHWTTEPDTAVKRELHHSILIGDEFKFFNFRTLYNNPWNFNLPQNAPVAEFYMESISGKPAKVFFSNLILCGLPDNEMNPQASNLYSLRMIGYLSYGLSIGHCFFINCKHPFLRAYLSAGLVYNGSMWMQNGKGEYVFGDLMAHVQLMLEYPKGLYITGKKSPSSMEFLTFSIKVGYDFPLQQVQQIPLFDSQHSIQPILFPPMSFHLLT